MSDEPSPEPVLETLVAYQRAAALRGAIELDLFTAVGAGARTAQALAERLGASERGVRSLCDHLVVQGFLTKHGLEYALSPTAAVFLDRASERCIAPVATFLGSPRLRAAFEDVAAVVRRGRTLLDGEGTMGPEHPVWVDFARGMAPAVRPQTERVAELIGPVEGRVLDVAAGHGLYGIAVARANPGVRIVAQDWEPVLAVALENARAAGVEERYETLPGDARTVDLGGPFALVLLTNLLHHYDPPTCEAFLRRVRAALAPGGRVVAVESVPHEDRVSPPRPATFSLVLLATTAGGDSYTEREWRAIFAGGGFEEVELHALPDSVQHAIVTRPA